jgi:hypothetical protein
MLSKLLVDAPTGEQQLIEVGQGGGYFDPARVIWDDRADGEVPEITLGGMVRQGNALVYSGERFAVHQAAVAPAVPYEIPALKGLLIIEQYGLATAYDAWASNPARTFSERAYISTAVNWQRDNPVLLAGAVELGLTSEQIDAMFIAAAGL